MGLEDKAAASRPISPRWQRALDCERPCFLHGQLEATELIYEGDEVGWSDDDCMVVVDSVQVEDGAGGWGSKRARTHE